MGDSFKLRGVPQINCAVLRRIRIAVTKSYLEIHDCAQMLDDVLVINSHHIDRVLKFSMGAHEAIPFENGAAPVELYVFKVRVAIKMRVKLLLVE